MEKLPLIDMKQTGRRIRFYMEMNQMTPAEIRRKLNLNCVRTVTRWLSGDNVPNIDNLYSLSQLFQVRLDDIIVGDRRRIQVKHSVEEFRGRLLRYYDQLGNVEAR